ncbi:MAG: response regulator transcription factor [Treponema sp.]|jgi:DNA-binding response OmpR family regulator|nr:response regulator transcription factor [Treponema sp.]
MPDQALVLVVDDEVKILDMVSAYLEKSGYRPLMAQTGTEALSLLQQHPVSLVLLDLMLPDISGEALCRKVRAGSAVPIIMMTAKVDEGSIIHGLGMGADDYVTKPFSPRQLMARVAAVLRRSGIGGTAAVERRVLTWEGLSVDTENRQVSKNGETITLTPHEYKILALLMAHPQKIFTRDEIIAGVKSDDYEGFDRTIDTHVKNLRQKIEDDSKTPKYIVTVYGMGYRFGGAAPS